MVWEVFSTVLCSSLVYRVYFRTFFFLLSPLPPSITNYRGRKTVMHLSSINVLYLTGLASLWLAAVSSYSMEPLHPFVQSFAESKHVPWNHSPQPLATKRRARYDLGIGKNKPVSNSKVSSFYPKRSSRKVVSRASSSYYWIDHQAVNPLPSPLPTPKKARTQPIVPNRMTANDVMTIHANRQATAEMRNFDLNTAWVEMLIHEQQCKLTPQALS